VHMYGTGNQGNLGTSAAPLLRRVVRTYQVDKYNAQVNRESNTMTFNFGSEGLNLPTDAQNVVTGVPLVIFWNKLDNITVPSYVKIRYPNPDLEGGTVDIRFEVPAGMWDITALSQKLETAFVLAPISPAGGLDKNFITIDGDAPTQTVMLRFQGPGAIQFGSSELAYLLGFVEGKGAPDSEWKNKWHECDGSVRMIVAPFMAHVQSVEFLQLRCSLLGAGQGIVGRGGGGEGVIATLPITGQAYGQSLYTRGMGEMLTFPLRFWRGVSNMTLSLIDNDGFLVKGMSPALPWTAQVCIMFDTYSDQS
jgi:hypothetical protein